LLSLASVLVQKCLNDRSKNPSRLSTSTWGLAAVRVLMLSEPNKAPRVRTLNEFLRQADKLNMDIKRVGAWGRIFSSPSLKKNTQRAEDQGRNQQESSSQNGHDQELSPEELEKALKILSKAV